MAHPQTPESVVNLDGMELRLVFDLNALILLEEKTGVDLVNGETLALGPKQVRTLIWCGALRHHPDLTEEEVGSYIHLGNIKDLGAQVGQLLRDSMPEAKDDPKAEAPEANPASE